MTAHYRLTGRLEVALPPEEAFRLFTPRGEEDWATGWEPRFPVAVTDDAAPGTVFQTHGGTTWVVTDRSPGRRISYARVTPGIRAGTVTVELSGDDERSDVDVTYELTALAADAEVELSAFAAGYPAYLRSWQEDIASYLARRVTQLPDPAM